ncbi:CPK20, partial [Symbiodinium sp. CCMP2456]
MEILSDDEESPAAEPVSSSLLAVPLVEGSASAEVLDSDDEPALTPEVAKLPSTHGRSEMPSTEVKPAAGTPGAPNLAVRPFGIKMACSSRPRDSESVHAAAVKEPSSNIKGTPKAAVQPRAVEDSDNVQENCEAHSRVEAPEQSASLHKVLAEVASLRAALCQSE